MVSAQSDMLRRQKRDIYTNLHIIGGKGSKKNWNKQTQTVVTLWQNAFIVPFFIRKGYSWDIRGVFVGYSWDIRMYRVCVGYVSGMYRECIGGDKERISCAHEIWINLYCNATCAYCVPVIAYCVLRNKKNRPKLLKNQKCLHIWKKSSIFAGCLEKTD